MDYATFLHHVIEDGIRAAREDYAKPEQAAKLEGSIAGFEDCRGKSPDQLKRLLNAVNATAQRAFEEQIDPPDYWIFRCRALEVEWVCNVVSAMLVNEGKKPIVPPTARGTTKAAEVLARRN